MLVRFPMLVWLCYFVSTSYLRKLFQRGSNFDYVFLVDEGREGPYTTKVGQHRPASETPFKWRFAGELMVVHHSMLAGSFVVLLRIQTSIAKKLIIFVIIRGGGGSGPSVPSGSTHAFGWLYNLV